MTVNNQNIILVMAYNFVFPTAFVIIRPYPQFLHDDVPNSILNAIKKISLQISAVFL